MHTVTLHLIWGELAVSRYRMRQFDNTVLLAHAAYDFRSIPESEAFLQGVTVARDPHTWMLVTSAIDITRLGLPLKSKLFAAVERGDVTAVEEILDNGVTPNTRAPNGLTPLQTAALKGHAIVAEVLLNRGAKASLVTDNVQKESPLHLMSDSFSPQSERLAAVLIDAADSDINAFNATGQTPLMKAVAKGNLPIAVYLMEKGANPDYEDEAGNSARSLFMQKYEGIIQDPIIDKFHKHLATYDAVKTSAHKNRKPHPFPSPYHT